MPSTLVHLAVAALLAAALLGRAYDARSLAVVLAVTAVPDLDTFLGLWVPGAHRAALHTALFPLAVALLAWWDLRVRDRSAIRRRLGPDGPRVAGVAVASLAAAGVAPDFVANGVNLFYPLHDQFYALTGHLVVSTDGGVVQTFVDVRWPTLDGGRSVVGTSVGNTSTQHYQTGVDPAAGPEDPGAVRTFYVLQSGTSLLLVVLGAAVTAVRLRDQVR